MRIPVILAVAVLLLVSSCGEGPDGNGLNVLLILIDTLRADHVHCYGYERETTPTMDSLAATGMLFMELQSQSSWTLPAMATILSGVSPREHGAGRTMSGEFYGISPELPSMPLHFHSRGYETAAFFNVIFMSEDFGFHYGFDHFDCQGLANRHSIRMADQTVDIVLEWLDTRSGEEPFFMAVHFYDPHIPYNPPEPWNTLWADPDYHGEYDCKWGSIPEMKAINSGETTIPATGLENIIGLYDGEIAFTDDQLGRLLEELRDRGLSGNTLVVVMADHGEEFLEHGRVEHGVDLYQEVLHVPLIISGPGVPVGEIIDTPVSQMDIFPTLIALTGLEPHPGVAGVDILEIPEENRDLPASGVLWANGELAALRRGDLKVIWNAGTDSLESYDLATDPGEFFRLDPDSSLINAVLFYWATPALVQAPLVPFGETLNRELRDLGYIR